MKTKLKNIITIFFLALLFIPSIAIAESNESSNNSEINNSQNHEVLVEENLNKNNSNITLEESEETIVDSNPDIEEENNISEDTGKKTFLLDPHKKDEIFTSRGTIIENKKSDGTSFESDKNIEVLHFTTNSGNNLHLLVDYRKDSHNVILLGDTNEQELSSLTRNMTEEKREEERRDSRIKAQLEKERNKDKEKIEEKKNDKSKISNLLKKLFPIIIAVFVVIFGLVFKKLKSKNNEIEEFYDNNDYEE